MRPCSIPGCGRSHYGKGFCFLHYQRERRGTDMNAPAGFRHGFAVSFIDAVSKRVEDDCVLWPYGQNGNGYGTVKYPGIPGTAARVVCVLAHGKPIQAKMDVAHSCGNKLCVNPQHLRWATRAENERDKVQHGRSNRGSRQGHSKLTEADVLAIRAQPWRRGIDLATEYGVSEETISHVRNGQNWNWL